MLKTYCFQRKEDKNMANISSRESGTDLMDRNDMLPENDAAERVVYLAQDI